MKLLIVGGDKSAYFLGRAFLSKGYHVTVVNPDREECARLARTLPKAVIVHGNGSSPEVLEDAGAKEVETVLALTPQDQDNLVITQLAERRFGVPMTLALVNDPDNEAVFRELGVRETFSMTRLLATVMEQRIDFSEITNLIPAGEGKVNIAELTLDEDAPAAGKALCDLGLPEDALVAGIVRNGRPLVPRGATVLVGGDRLVLVTLPQNHGAVLKHLTGEP